VKSKAVLEGLLFVVGEDGLTLDQIEEVIGINEEEAKETLTELKHDYENDERGIRIDFLGNRFKLTTKSEHREYFQKLIENPETNVLSQAALETLAIIAYNAPITRLQIDALRGVSSVSIVRKLVAKGFIKESGRSDLPGRPILYETTSEFLDYFGLATIEDLPDNITKIRFAGDRSGHYYRTARLAATLTSMYNKGVSKEQQISLPSITLAALLHDYGMRFSNDPDSLGKLKVGKFDYESQAMLNAPYKDKHSSVYSRLKIVDVISGPYNEKYHTAYAYVALKDKVPTEVREMILYSQYTKDAFSSRKHKKVIKAANIISLCEVYDNLLEYVIKSDMAAPIENVITYLGQLAHNGVLDMDVFTLFLNNISLYPVGTKVLLSDNQYAVVVRNNSGFPSKPLVLTLTPASSVLIDLSETTNITIRRIVKTDEEVDKVDVIHSEQLNGVFDEDIIPSGENPGTLILKKGETDGEKILGKKF